MFRNALRRAKDGTQPSSARLRISWLAADQKLLDFLPLALDRGSLSLLDLIMQLEFLPGLFLLTGPIIGNRQPVICVG